MPYEMSQVMDLLVKLSEEEGLRLCVTQAARGAAAAGTGALVGGLLGGPVGMAVGGTIGSVFGAATAKDFKPLPTVLQQLPPTKKRELTQRVNQVLASLDPGDALALIALVQGSAVIRLKVLDAMKSYFTDNGQSIQ